MKQRHRAAVVDRNTIIFPTNVYHPDEIIELVQMVGALSPICLAKLS
jgi:hypothetical protein